MGACGCGDFSPSYQFPGPRGITYTLSIYMGCNYCETPVGIVITRFDKKEAAHWCLETVPELPVQPFDPDYTDKVNGEFAQAIVSPCHVLKAIAGHMKGMTLVDEDGEKWDSVEEFIECADDFEDALEASIRKTIEGKDED